MARKNITAILATSGISSRFRPLSNRYHKTLVKVGGEALIRRTIDGLIKNGVKDIVITYAPGDKDGFVEVCKGIKAKIKYVLVDTPLSTGIVLKVGLPHVSSKNDLLILNGGQLRTSEYLKKILNAKTPKNYLKVLTAESKRPWEYAVLKFKREGWISEIIEKPKQDTQPSNIRTAGIYFVPANFREYILTEPESPFSLINAFNKFIKDFGGAAIKLDHEPTSIKYAFDLLDVTQEFTNDLKKNISKKAGVSKKATINGEVVIGDGTRVMEQAVIHGPVWIGRNCVIGNNVVIRPNTVIEDGVELGTNTEVKRSYIGESTHIHSGYVGDSVIGENCRIGAGFLTANRRIDRKDISFEIKGEKVDSGKSYLGCVMGAGTKTGVYASTMPGTIIGSNCVIGSNTEVKGTIPSNSTVYIKQELVVKQND